jgi:hypothetical protein
MILSDYSLISKYMRGKVGVFFYDWLKISYKFTKQYMFLIIFHKSLENNQLKNEWLDDMLKLFVTLYYLSI